MNLVRHLQVFLAIAEHENMASAARALRTSTSAVSRHLKELEDWAGVALFQRTTRSISLTEAGAEKLETARTILRQVDTLRHVPEDELTRPLLGKLRVTAPEFVLKSYVARRINVLASRHPDLKIEIVATDRIVDMVAEGFDAALRIGDLPDSTLRAKKLCGVSLEIVAAPSYLERHGQPRSVADLKSHKTIVDTAPSYHSHWPVSDERSPRGVSVPGQILVSSGQVAAELAVNGVGIALLPNLLVRDFLRSGQLKPLLNEARKHQLGLHLIYPNTRFKSRKLHEFMNAMSSIEG